MPDGCLPLFETMIQSQGPTLLSSFWPQVGSCNLANLLEREIWPFNDQQFYDGSTVSTWRGASSCLPSRMLQVSSVPFSQLKGAALLNAAAGPSGFSTAAVGSAGVLIGTPARMAVT